jgi:hypothetical protein
MLFVKTTAHLLVNFIHSASFWKNQDWLRRIEPLLGVSIAKQLFVYSQLLSSCIFQWNLASLARSLPGISELASSLCVPLIPKIQVPSIKPHQGRGIYPMRTPISSLLLTRYPCLMNKILITNVFSDIYLLWTFLGTYMLQSLSKNFSGLWNSLVIH